MDQTPNIGFKKYNRVTDGALFFNLDDALGDNWDLADTAINELRHRVRIAVAGMADLKAIDTTNITDNALIICKALGLFRLDKTSAAAGDDKSIVQPTNGAGRWIRIAIATNDYVMAPAFGDAAGAANAYTFTSVPAPSAYVDGMGVIIRIPAAAGNTGASTLTWGALAAKAIVDSKGTALIAGKLKAGLLYHLRYNATAAAGVGNFQLQGEGGEYGDAAAGDVRAPRTIGTNAGIVAGTAADNGPAAAETINLTTEGSEYTIAAGFHSGLRKIKAVITGLIAGVLKAGTTVGGILGTFTNDATATAGQMLLGATAWVKGVLITGTIASKAAATYTPSQSVQTIAANQFLSGAQTISAVPVDASKVLAGTTIAGKAGTMPNLSGKATEAVAISVDGTILVVRPPEGYFNGISGSTVKITDADFIAANIRADKNIFGLQGGMSVNASQTATLQITGSAKPTKAIPAGYVPASTITAELAAALAPSIKKSAVIGGVTGTLVLCPQVVAGEVLLAGTTTSAGVMYSTYTKIRDITVNVAGTVRVKYIIRNSNTTDAYSRIYVNGIAVGIEHQNTTPSTSLTFTEDINVKYGDHVQVYVKSPYTLYYYDTGIYIGAAIILAAVNM